MVVYNEISPEQRLQQQQDHRRRQKGTKPLHVTHRMRIYVNVTAHRHLCAADVSGALNSPRSPSCDYVFSNRALYLYNLYLYSLYLFSLWSTVYTV